MNRISAAKNVLLKVLRVFPLVMWALGMMTTPALAALVCTQKVVSLTVNPDGAVWVEFSGADPAGRTVMCNTSGSITAQIGGSTGNITVTPETCKAWISMFLTAQATQKDVVLKFDSTALTTCALMPSFKDTYPIPFPYWVSIIN